jgi:hypothetical protein
MPHTDEITITVYRGTDPVLITGEPIVVRAVLAALRRALGDRQEPGRALRLVDADAGDGAQGGDGDRSA